MGMNQELSNETREQIKKVAKFHFGFTPRDYDIDWIDKMLRNNYVGSHVHRIIEVLVANNAGNNLLKHRDRLGSERFERILLEKTIFKYLTFASMCFKEGIPAGTISLCRTAFEAGLRERLAEELTGQANSHHSSVLKKVKEQRDKLLKQLIEEAARREIISKQDIEEAFEGVKLGDEDSRRVLDKFIHGDVVWLVDFARSRNEIVVRGAKDEMEEYKIISEGAISQIAINVLRATYNIGEILYLKNV